MKDDGSRALEALIIGAGFAGICLGKRLLDAGISNFRKMLDLMENTAPLRRNVTIDEVGNAAAFLCSDLASGITGDVLYVDSGYHILGMA